MSLRWVVGDGESRRQQGWHPDIGRWHLLRMGGMGWWRVTWPTRSHEWDDHMVHIENPGSDIVQCGISRPLMQRLLASLACSGTIVLAGCVNPVLVKVSYESPVAHTSEKSASIQLTTGVVEADPGPAYSIPFRPNPSLHFNHQDQRIFVESLKDELNRLKLLRVGQVSERQVDGADVSIEVVFQRTTAFPPAHRYILDVAMRLKSGERGFARRYLVYSAEGESFWTNMNTNAAEGKELAARKLMARLIPDIEAFVAAAN